MRYSTEPRDRRCVKQYGFLFFAQNTGKNLSSRYRQKFLDQSKNIILMLLRMLQKGQF